MALVLDSKLLSDLALVLAWLSLMQTLVSASMPRNANEDAETREDQQPHQKCLPPLVSLMF